MQDAIDGYRRTDLAAAAKFDATIPATPSAPWLQPDPVGSTGFSDRSEPQNLLKAPADYSADYSFEMKWHSYLSPDELRPHAHLGGDVPGQPPGHL